MLKVVTGKPGAGKTYHVVGELVRDVLDWCEHEKKTGEPFGRKCFTNLPINREAFAAYIKEKGGYDFDPAYYIEELSFVDPGGEIVDPKTKKTRPKEWFDMIPDGALVVVDEVHEELGRERDYYDERMTAFRDYAATHRHHGHDLVMISQHIENVSMDILRIAESIEEVQNLKTGRIPIVGIPIADIDVVRRAWGSESQVYRISFGRVVGRAIKWGEAVSTHRITPAYYGLYDSHNKRDGSSGAGDRPTLRLGRIASLRWFVGRHGFKVSWRVAAVVLVLVMVIQGLQAAPRMLQGLVRIKGPGGVVKKVGSEKELPGSQPMAAAGDVASEPNMQLDQLKIQQHIEQLQKEMEALKKQSEVAAVFNGGVLLRDGTRVDVGESIMIEGEEEGETLEKVDPLTGRVLWSSGKEVWLR